MIWKTKPDVNIINSMSKNTIVELLGIEITEVGDDYIKGKMPVDERTKQPAGLLHGGASVTLAESLGSIAGFLIIEDLSKQYVVGLEITAHHLRSAKSGYVYATTKAVKVGRKIQLWRTDIYDDQDRHICTSELSTMIVDR